MPFRVEEAGDDAAVGDRVGTEALPLALGLNGGKRGVIICNWHIKNDMAARLLRGANAFAVAGAGLDLVSTSEYPSIVRVIFQSKTYL
jgi:hypothetical protein